MRVLLPAAASFAAATLLAYLLAGDTGLLAAVALTQLLTLMLVAALARSQITAAARADQRSRTRSAKLRATVNKRGFENRRRLDRLQTDLDLTREAGMRHTAELHSTAALHYDLRPEESLPPAGGWAASADLLRYVHEVIRDEQRAKIVECGSGVSTLVMAYALRRLGDGAVVALEHDAEHAERTRSLLRRHGLQSWAEVRHAPLRAVEIQGRSWPWYDAAALPDGPLDLALIDGPPRATGDLARYPALPLLHDRLASDAVLILDDHCRADERAAATRWAAEYPALRRRVLKSHPKETLVLRKGLA